jgi:hypothetical protein
MHDKLKKYMEIANINYFWRLSSVDHLNMLDSAIEEIERQQAENARLKEYIKKYLDGDYPHPRTYRPHDCPHGVHYWKDCAECADEFLSQALTPQEKE